MVPDLLHLPVMRRLAGVLLVLLSGCVYGTGAYYTTTETAGPPRQSVTVEDLRSLSKAGVGDDVIVARIEAEGVAAKPTADQIAQLKGEGLSDRVIQAWVSAKVTPATTTRRVVYRTPYYYGGYYPYPYYGGYWGWGYPYWGYSYYRHYW